MQQLTISSVMTLRLSEEDEHGRDDEQRFARRAGRLTSQFDLFLQFDGENTSDPFAMPPGY